MDFKGTPQNPTSSDTSKNDSVDKIGIPNFTDSTMQNDSTRKASTSNKHQKLGHISCSPDGNNGDIKSSDYVNYNHLINPTPNSLPEHQLVATTNSNNVPNGSELKGQIELTSFNSILNENAFNANLECTFDTTHSNDSTIKETLNSTFNSSDTTLRENLNSTPNNYSHLGARPKTPLNTNPKEPRSLFKGAFKNTTNKMKKV